MAYSLDAINKKGDNLMWIVQLDSTLAVVASLVDGSNCLNLGHITTHQSAFTSSKEELKSEDGKARKTEFEFSGMYSATLMQTNAALVNYLRDSTKGQRHLLGVKHFTRDSGVVTEEFAIVDVTPQGTISGTEGHNSNAFEATAAYPDTSITFNSTVLASIETAFSIAIATTSVSITPAKGYYLVDT